MTLFDKLRSVRETGKPFVYIPIEEAVYLRSSCGSVGPLAWGRVEWSPLGRVYFVFATPWFAVWF